MGRNSPPSLVELFIKLYWEDLADGNYKDMFPWCFLLCIGLGFLVGNAVGIPLWRDKSNLVAIFSALVTAQGILLALSLNSMQQVYLSISSGDFSKKLREHNVLDGYIYLIRFHQIVNVISLLSLVIALLFVYLYGNLNKVMDSIFQNVGGFDEVVCSIVSLSLGFFFYSLKQTSDSFKMASDLSYLKAEYEDQKLL